MLVADAWVNKTGTFPCGAHRVAGGGLVGVSIEPKRYEMHILGSVISTYRKIRHD